MPIQPQSQEDLSPPLRNNGITIAYERRNLSDIEQDALSLLNQAEFQPTKRALFRLLENYKHDLANHYFATGRVTNEDFFLKLEQFKRAVEKAHPIDTGLKKTKTKTRK